MKHQSPAPGTHVLVFDIDDDPVAELTAFAKRQQLGGAFFTGVGAFRRAVVAFFDWERKEYDRIAVDEQVEVLALTGNVAMHEGEPKVHAHVVIGKRDGTAHGGHLLEASVRPTLELVLTTTPSALRRRYDPEAKLPLMDL